MVEVVEIEAAADKKIGADGRKRIGVRGLERPAVDLSHASIGVGAGQAGGDEQPFIFAQNL